MNKKNGFTLIELLAVIVILAIIALIAVPIIMGVINDAKKGAAKDSMYGYVEAVELENAKKMMSNEGLQDGTYQTKTGNLYQDDTKVLDINFKGTAPSDAGTVTLTGGRVTNAVLNFGGYEVTYDGQTATVAGESKPTSTPAPSGEKAVTLITNKNISGNNEGLITDDTESHNIRYAGSNNAVKNYVTFNNEMWRIIGVFNGRIKIIRNESIGENTFNSGGSINNWPSTSLCMYLNNAYIGTMASSKEMIENTTYYLGGIESGITKNIAYTKERSTDVYSGHATTWTGKIGLMYTSDYAFAAGSECVYNEDGDQLSLDEYNEKKCKENNWMYSGKNEWTITPHSKTVNVEMAISTSGNVTDSFNARIANSVRPTVYLKATVKIISGTGTSTDPYQLGL